MIFGLIPIGGKGTRLGLPFSKEMLPRKNFNTYNPVVNHLVEKMLLAGAGKIVFVHGLDYKQDVQEYFAEDKYIHILQNELGFANVVKDFYITMNASNTDKVLFGLPDSIFNGNPFIEMLTHEGIVAGCFTTSSHSKVDRILKDIPKFEIKVSKNENNQDWFWGVIKFDMKDITKMINENVFNKTSEIGSILNMYNVTMVKGDEYLDLGTWDGYNQYLTGHLL